MYESTVIRVLLTAVAYAPKFLVMVTGLILILTNAPSGKLRILGAMGVGIALGSHLVGSFAMSMLPSILLTEFHFDYETFIPIFQAAAFTFNLFEALGYGLLFMATIQAFRQLRAGSRSRP